MEIPNTITFVLGPELRPRLEKHLQRLARGFDPVLGTSFSKLMRAFVEEALERMEARDAREGKKCQK